MSNFYTDVILADVRLHTFVQVRDLMLLEPVTRAAVPLIIADALTIYGETIFVTETYRSSERQRDLFAQGATTLQTVGLHHYGLAVDFAKLSDGRASWDGDWTFLAELAVKYKLISGVNWNTPPHPGKFIDKDHIQRCSIAEEKWLFAGTWYPDDQYDPYALSIAA